MLWNGTAAESAIRTEFQQFVRQTRLHTAPGTATLETLSGTNPGEASRIVQNLFDLGRFKVGHNRSFYPTPFDVPYGQFGGEWALVIRLFALKWGA